MNNYLNKQIEYSFGKKFEDMSDEEKRKITEITLFLKDFNGEQTGISIADLLSFPNLKKCLINGFSITDEDLKTLGSIESLRGIQFSKCDFSEATVPLGNMELVILDSCERVPNDFFRNNTILRFLRVVNQSHFDVEALADCVNLIEAYLQRTTISNLAGLSELKSLKFVNLDGSKFNFLAYTSLKSSVQVEYKKDSMPELGR